MEEGIKLAKTDDSVAVPLQMDKFWSVANNKETPDVSEKKYTRIR